MVLLSTIKYSRTHLTKYNISNPTYWQTPITTLQEIQISKILTAGGGHIRNGDLFNRANSSRIEILLQHPKELNFLYWLP